MKKTLMSLLAGLVVASTLVACGGGGSGAGAVGSNAGGSGTTGIPSIKLALDKTTISIGNGAKVKATVKRGEFAVPNVIITFAIEPNALARVTSQNGQQLTDKNGIAEVQLDPLTFASGPATITATVTVQSNGVDNLITDKVSFTVLPPTNIALVNMGAALPPNGSLSAYSNVNVSVGLQGIPGNYPSAFVRFSSACARAGKATFLLTPDDKAVEPTGDVLVLAKGGVATTTYQDAGCSATGAVTDEITATLEGTTIRAQESIKVAVPNLAAIQFISTTPLAIAVNDNTAPWAPTSSTVVFKLLDKSSNPLAFQFVALSLNTRNGGVLLDGTADGSVVKKTNALGEVEVVVKAGQAPVTLWVIAQQTNGAGETISTQSPVIRITRGLPSQSRFVLSASPLNIEAGAASGVARGSIVTASLADIDGNATPDGSSVNFLFAGSTFGSSCVSSFGTCSTGIAGFSGRTRVVGYTVGEETYWDQNANGVIESNEFQDLGNVYLDTNLNGSWDAGEPEVVFAPGNLTACAASIFGTQYPSKVDTCDGLRGRAHIRNYVDVYGVGSQLAVQTSASINLASCAPVTATFTVTDGSPNNFPLPFGTAISVSGAPAGWTIGPVQPGTVPSTSTPSVHSVTVSPPGTACTDVWRLLVTATTPGGTVSSSNANQITGYTTPLPIVPAAPTILSVVPGAANGSVKVTFLPGAIPGTSYTTFCNTAAEPAAPVPQTASAAQATGASPVVVGGLASTATAGATITATCTVVATNTGGNGPGSAPVSGATK